MRSGRNVFEDVYEREFFDYLNEEAPESAYVFNRAMTTSSEQSARDVANLLDPPGVSSVADIGGGQGQVLVSLLEKHPGMHGTLLDLPGVVENADPRLRGGGSLAERVRVVAGDCREDIPVQAGPLHHQEHPGVGRRQHPQGAGQHPQGGAARCPRRRHREPRGRHPVDAVHHGRWLRRSSMSVVRSTPGRAWSTG